MAGDTGRTDIVILGTFSVWGLGSLQARALPLARAIHRQTPLRLALVTTPWDAPDEAGAIDAIDGVPVINTSVTSPRAALLAAGEQLRWVDRLHPRIVHLFKPRGFGGLAAEFVRHARRDIRLLVDTDDWEGYGGWNERNDYSLLQRRLFAWQERSLVAHADHVTAASRLLEHRARGLRSDPESVTYLPNGLERAWIDQLRAAREAAANGPTTPTVLLYSRFAEFPAGWLERYTRALGEQIAGTVKLALVGDPGEMQIPSSTASVEIETHGFVARERLPEVLATATLAVYPYEDNLINRSKQSVKLLELMAAGCPVIASDVGEVAATLGSSGCLLHGSDPEDFASATREMLCQQDRLDAFAQQAQRRVNERFDLDGLAARLARVYDGLGVLQPC